jgi:hypothetical protein
MSPVPPRDGGPTRVGPRSIGSWARIRLIRPGALEDAHRTRTRPTAYEHRPSGDHLRPAPINSRGVLIWLTSFLG